MIRKLLIYFFVFSILQVFAQGSKFPIKKINGIDFYIYTVETSEGLYAIARKFNIQKEIIERYNSTVTSGLKPNQQLLIPVKEVGKFATNSLVAPSKLNEDQYLLHKVEKQQTIFAVCKKYGITQEQLKKNNPQIKNGLQEGMVLKISIAEKPSEVFSSKNTKPQHGTTLNYQTDTTKKIIHKVQAGETLYSIARRYSTTIDKLISINKIVDGKLVNGTELFIEDSSSTSSKVSENDNLLDIRKLLDKSEYKNFSKNKKLRIAFLLPFMLDKPKSEINNTRFVEFYSGALLSVDQWKQRGMSFEIYTYDTDNSTEKLVEVLQNSELKTMDLIVGPAFSNLVSQVSDFCLENQIPTLIPFTSKVNEIESNPYLLQFNPGSEVEVAFIIEKLKRMSDINIVFLEIPGVSSMDEGYSSFIELKKAMLLAKKEVNSKLLVSPESFDISAELNPEVKNIIVFNTDKYSIASRYIYNLANFISRYQISLLGQYSWQLQNLSVPVMNFATPFAVDIDVASVNKFNRTYQSFYSRPMNQLQNPRYDLLGFDLLNFFIPVISSYGNKLPNIIDAVNYTSGIQSQPVFEKIGKKGGYLNRKLYFGSKNSDK